MGVEPTYSAWEADVLPMNYIRIYENYCSTHKMFFQVFLFVSLCLTLKRAYDKINKTKSLSRVL